MTNQFFAITVRKTSSKVFSSTTVHLVRKTTALIATKIRKPKSKLITSLRKNPILLGQTK
jgi:hypothetical protein